MDSNNIKKEKKEETKESIQGDKKEVTKENELNDKKEEASQNIPKNLLLNIKSLYILKNSIFDFFTKNKSLEIIKYNKKIQNKLSLDINKYKEFSENHTKIEIEVIPNEKKIGSLINILSREEESYYHIFFNNSTFMPR